MSKRPGWDSLLLAVLVLALIQITGLAEQAALPTLVQDVLRHPILGALLPPSGIAAMSTEEAYYWYAKATQPAHGPRALRALRLLLSDDER